MVWPGCCVSHYSEIFRIVVVIGNLRKQAAYVVLFSGNEEMSVGKS